MRVFHFTEQPYSPAWKDNKESLRITIPNKRLDPKLAGDLFHRYYDEWQLADELGFDIIPLDEYGINGGQYAGGIDPIMWKWNFTSGCKIAPYFAVVGGALFSPNNLPPPNTAQVNFTSGPEIGTQIFRKGSTNSWDVMLKAYHLSNASIGNHNPGLNASLQVMLGYTWH